MQEIHLLFPRPGRWDKFTMTARYEDADGYTLTYHYTQDNIPADQALVLEAAVTAIASMGEDWQASQVWARLAEVVDYRDDPDSPPITTVVVELTVEAVHAQGGRRIFTARDYPAFVLTSPNAVTFFRYFTDAEVVNF